MSGPVAGCRGHADVMILSFGYLILRHLLHLVSPGNAHDTRLTFV